MIKIWRVAVLLVLVMGMASLGAASHVFLGRCTDTTVCYKFDDDSSPTEDYSGNDFDADWLGTPSTGFPGATRPNGNWSFNEAYMFNDSSSSAYDSAINTTRTLDNSNEFTVSFWAYPVDLDAGGTTTNVWTGSDGSSSGWLVWDSGADNKWTFRMYDGGGSNIQIKGSNMQTDAWVHILAGWNGTHIALYENNTRTAMTAVSTHTLSNLNTFIGGSSDQREAGGRIDEYKWFDRWLTSSERTKLFEENTINPNTAPDINSNRTDPPHDQIDFNETFSAYTNVTDPDGSVSAVNLTYTQGSSTVFSDINGSVGYNGSEWNWTNVSRANKTDVWHNLTFTAVDDSGATSTSSIKFFLENKSPGANILEPENRSYFSYNNSYRIRIKDDGDDVLNERVTCDLWDDGEEFRTVEAWENDSQADRTFSGYVQHDVGSREFLAQCVDGNEVNRSVSYQVDRWRIRNSSSANLTRETENTTYTGWLELGEMIQDVEATLWWNDSSSDTASLTHSGIENTSIQLWHQPPLVESNNTREPWNISFTANYTDFNSSTYSNESRNTSIHQQNVTLAYFVGNLTISKDRAIEDLDFSAWFDNSSSFTDPAASWNSSITYHQNTTLNGSNITTRGDLITGTTPWNRTDNLTGSTTFTFQNSRKTLSTATKNITVYNKILTDCSAGSASQDTSLKFTLREEENNSATVNGDIDYNLDVYDRLGRNYTNYAFSRSGETVETCIYPSWAQYNVSGPIDYEADNYTKRKYQLYRVDIDNTTVNYDLYLLDEDKAVSVFFNVETNDGQSVDQATIKVMRYFTGKDSYITVTKSETDSEGVASTELRVNDIYYKYIITKEGVVLKETEKQILSCESVPCKKTFIIDPDAVSPYFKDLAGFSHQCQVNEATSSSNASLQCSVSHDTGSFQWARLLVQESQELRGYTQKCNITTSTVGNSMVCTLGNLSEKSYKWKLLGKKDGNTYVLDTDTIDRVPPLFGSDTLTFAAFIMYLAIVMIGLYRPEGAILMAGLGILVPGWLGFYKLPLASFGAIITVIAITGLEARR